MEKGSFEGKRQGGVFDGVFPAGETSPAPSHPTRTVTFKLPPVIVPALSCGETDDEEPTEHGWERGRGGEDASSVRMGRILRQSSSTMVTPRSSMTLGTSSRLGSVQARFQYQMTRYKRYLRDIKSQQSCLSATHQRLLYLKEEIMAKGGADPGEIPDMNSVQSSKTSCDLETGDSGIASDEDDAVLFHPSDHRGDLAAQETDRHTSEYDDLQNDYKKVCDEVSRISEEKKILMSQLKDVNQKLQESEAAYRLAARKAIGSKPEPLREETGGGKWGSLFTEVWSRLEELEEVVAKERKQILSKKEAALIMERKTVEDLTRKINTLEEENTQLKEQKLDVKLQKELEERNKEIDDLKLRLVNIISSKSEGNRKRSMSMAQSATPDESDESLGLSEGNDSPSHIELLNCHLSRLDQLTHKQLTQKRIQNNVIKTLEVQVKFQEEQIRDLRAMIQERDNSIQKIQTAQCECAELREKVSERQKLVEKMAMRNNKMVTRYKSLKTEYLLLKKKHETSCRNLFRRFLP